MKLKKYNYIIVLIITLFVGMNNTYAKEPQTNTCNYISNGNQAMARLTVKWDYDVAWTHANKAFTEVHFQKLGEKIDNDSETILNWYKKFNDKVTGMTLSGIHKNSAAANKSGTCPEYLIVRTKDNYKSYGAFATNNQQEAQRFVNISNQNGYKAWYLKYKNADGSKITDDQYFKGFGFVESESVIDKNGKVSCTELFGDKNDPDSLANLIHSILQYIRIIVPILIILLGMIDLAKAVIASKEDEMKKAQSTFIKRVIIGVAVFFVPVLVDVVMWFADIVWEGMGYTVCEFK